MSNRALLSEAFLKASQLTRSSKALPKVYVYVEDDSDKSFWRDFFTKFEERFVFVISVYHKGDNYYFGKDLLIKDVYDGKLIASKHSLICVDSDLDYIIDNYHKYTTFLRLNPYIIDTVWYAVENVKCNPENVKDYLYKITMLENIGVDVDKQLSIVSELFHGLYLICLYSIQNNDDYYCLNKFRKDLSLLSFEVDGSIKETSKQKIRKIIKSHSAYIDKNKESINIIESSLKIKGYDKTSYLSLIRGHDLVEKVIVPYLTTIGIYLRNEYKKKICKGFNNLQKNNFINKYHHQTGAEDRGLNQRILDLIRDSSVNPKCQVCPVINKLIESALQ